MDIPCPEYLLRVVSAVKADPEIEETEDEDIQQVLQSLFTSLARRRLILLNNINHLTAKEKINHVYPETII